MEIKEVCLVKTNVYRVAVVLQAGTVREGGAVQESDAAVVAHVDFDPYGDGTDDTMVHSKSGLLSPDDCREIVRAALKFKRQPVQ